MLQCSNFYGLSKLGKPVTGQWCTVSSLRGQDQNIEVLPENVINNYFSTAHFICIVPKSIALISGTLNPYTNIS